MTGYEDSIRDLIDQARAGILNGRDLTDQEVCRAKCEVFSKELQARHPELTLQAGFIHHKKYADMGLRGSEHWWCVAPDGSIVDPSVAQFGKPAGGSFSYTVFDPKTHRIVIGKCMNCGAELFGLQEEGPKSVCDTNLDYGINCQEELERYYS